MASKKLTWLLILQAWTMLWVVIGHAPLSAPASESMLDNSVHSLAQVLFVFAYSFHMPLFIMISGYLFYRTRIARGWNYLEMVKEKWLRLGIPYLAFISLAIIVKICLPGGVNRAVDLSPSGLVLNYLSPFDGALQEMWFVAAIFIYFLLYPVYGYMLKSAATTIVSFCIAVGLYYIPVENMPNILAFNRAVHFFVYFLVGIIISHRNLDTIIARWSSIIICFVVYSASWFIHIGPFAPLCASLAFWGIAVKVDESLSNNLFHSFRNYTYQIFLVGIFAQIGIKALYHKLYFSGSYFGWWLICILLGIYSGADSKNG